MRLPALRASREARQKVAERGGDIVSGALLLEESAIQLPGRAVLGRIREWPELGSRAAPFWRFCMLKSLLQFRRLRCAPLRILALR